MTDIRVAIREGKNEVVEDRVSVDLVSEDNSVHYFNFSSQEKVHLRLQLTREAAKALKEALIAMEKQEKT